MTILKFGGNSKLTAARRSDARLAKPDPSGNWSVSSSLKTRPISTPSVQPTGSNLRQVDPRRSLRLVVRRTWDRPEERLKGCRTIMKYLVKLAEAA